MNTNNRAMPLNLMKMTNISEFLQGYDGELLENFFRQAVNFSPDTGGVPNAIGTLEFSNIQKNFLIIFKEISDIDHYRIIFKEIAENIWKKQYNGAIFIFYDNRNNYRLGYLKFAYNGGLKPRPIGRSVLVRSGAPNKTARQRLNLLLQSLEESGEITLDSLREALSVDAVTDAFYREFTRVFANHLLTGVRGLKEEKQKSDFVLAFVARVLFIAFVAKKGWLGERGEKFLPWLYERYAKLQKQKGVNSGSEEGDFYRSWLKPLFFKALRAAPGSKEMDFAHLPEEVRKAYSDAPYLNGELFRCKPEINDANTYLTDKAIKIFFDFLFVYNFTVEENTAYEVDLELNPEFLGLILEKLVNSIGVEGKADELGAHYTPRVEVDLMCRLSLAELLYRHGLSHEKAYALMDGNAEPLTGEEREKARQIFLDAKILDPAVGSGAFLVGMLQVLEDALDLLGEEKTLERKKRLLQNLHGVDALSWAVWMAELRLWLTYFLELDESHRKSPTPLLPSLGLKVVQGDSVAQTVGKRPVPTRLDADPELLNDSEISRALKELVQAKEGYFHNRGVDIDTVRAKEAEFLLLVFDKKYGTGKQGLGIGIKSEADEYREEREMLKEAIYSEKRPFLYLVDFAEVIVGRGGFDIVIGNPPYVQQEDIEDPLTPRRFSKEEYKSLLQKEAQKDIAQFVPYKGSNTKPHAPGGRSDLYVYFYARSLALLNSKGIHAFVVSNAWLDVGYGTWLQEVFLRVAPLRFVIDNRVKRSFEADINTVITVAWAPGAGVPEEWPTYFVSARSPFEEVGLVEKVKLLAPLLEEASR